MATLHTGNYRVIFDEKKGEPGVLNEEVILGPSVQTGISRDRRVGVYGSKLRRNFTTDPTGRYVTSPLVVSSRIVALLEGQRTTRDHVGRVKSVNVRFKFCQNGSVLKT